MAPRETSLSCKLACVIGMRHTSCCPANGIKRGERELLSANADQIEMLLTMLTLRDDWQGHEMAWHLQWLLLKAETRERRRSLFKF